MSCIQRRTLALALVAVMLLSVPITASICDDDSDAASAVDYSKWYYNQLDAPMKYAYNGLLNSTSSSTTVVVDIPNSITGNLYDDYVDGESEKLDLALNQLWCSVRCDSPETYCTYIESDENCNGTIVIDLKITFTIEDEYTSQKNKEIDDLIGSMEFTGSTVEKIKSIHDYVAKTLSYNFDEFEKEKETGESNFSIRSLYRALLGDHDVVCEGFARAFRAICEQNDIPCLLILDWVAVEGEEAMHMWNIVLVEGAWYTVDATWDYIDDSSVDDTYLLVGQSTVGVDGMTTAQSHLLKRTTGYGFGLPAPLATNEYGSDVATVSFDTGGGTAIAPITIEAGTVPTIPETTWSGHTFVAWYLDSDLTEIWDGSAIYSDCCLYAEWLSVEEHSASFEISGIYWAIILVVAILIVGAVAVKRHR